MTLIFNISYSSLNFCFKVKRPRFGKSIFPGYLLRVVHISFRYCLPNLINYIIELKKITNISNISNTEYQERFLSHVHKAIFKLDYHKAVFKMNCHNFICRGLKLYYYIIICLYKTDSRNWGRKRISMTT